MWESLLGLANDPIVLVRGVYIDIVKISKDRKGVHQVNHKLSKLRDIFESQEPYLLVVLQLVTP